MNPNTIANTSFPVDPSMYGRSPAGTAWIATVHATEAPTATARSPPAQARARRHPRTPTRVATTSAGRTNQACIIFAWKPIPMDSPVISSGHHRSVSTARCHHTSATASAAVSSPSSIG